MEGNFEYIIGSSRDCDLRLSHPTIAPRHAVFSRRGDRLFIKPLSESSPTYINGTGLAPGRFHEFTRYDRLRLSSLPVELSSNLFMGRRRVALQTSPLVFRGSRNRVLCEGVEVAAQPGTLTAIMGPSGCGKSILLKLLGGIYAPSEGEVFLVQNREVFKLSERNHPRTIGYLPQGDALHAELSNGKSLGYRLQLLFPDMAADVRRRLILQTVHQIGIAGRRGSQFLQTRLGSADATGAVLSGGERRRANLCHELINQPLVLLLDEVTSGLSSIDADAIIELLGTLARELGLTVLTTIHQPGDRTLARFDQLWLLTYGGRLVYRGPAKEAVERIRERTQLAPEGIPKAEYIAQAHELLAANPILDPLPALPPDNHRTHTVRPISRVKVPRWNFPLKILNRLRQAWILLLRQFDLLLRDKNSLGFAFLQIPILFLLVFVTFSGTEKNFADTDILLRTQHHFNSLMEKRGRYNIGMLEEAHQLGKTDSVLLGEAHAKHRASYLYVLTLIAIWFGLMSSCCEFVSRKAILEREYRSGISLLAALGAFFVSNCVVALIQSLLVVGLCLWFLPGFSIAAPLSLVLAVVSVTLVAVALGLFLSTLGDSARSALTLVPVCLIPQILLGGLFQPVSFETPSYAMLATANPQRWAFDLALRDSQLAERGVLTSYEGALVERSDLSLATSLQEFVRFRQIGIRDLYFPDDAITAHIPPLGVLALLGSLLLAAAYGMGRYQIRLASS